MGYLKNPILNKITRSGLHRKFSWGSCLMHNYRQTMQDHLIAHPEINRRFSMFGVLDGFDSDIFSKYVGTAFERNFKSIADAFVEKDENGKSDIDSAYSGVYFKTIIEKIESGHENPEFMEIFRELQIQDLKGKIENPIIDENYYGSDPEWVKRNLEKIQTKEEKFLEYWKRFYKYGGTTFLGLVIDERIDKILVANVGDSKGLISSSGQLIQELCERHDGMSPYEKSRIKNEGGRVYKSIKPRTCFSSGGRSLGMSRCIGCHEVKIPRKLERGGGGKIIIGTPDIYDFELKDDSLEFILIGTDGVFETQENGDIRKFILERMEQKMDEGKILEELFGFVSYRENQTLYKDFGKDNMAAVLINFKKKKSES